MIIDNRQKLSLLRTELCTQGLDGFIIPMNDAFQCEYVPDSDKRITFMTGFSGSSGTIIVLKDSAAFFTDGRYTLQATEQVDSTLYTLFDSGECPPTKWLKQHIAKGAVLGFDDTLHTVDNAASLHEACNSAGARLQTCKTNPIDRIWHDKPQPPSSKVIPHELRFAGESSASKRKKIAAQLQANGADAMLITLPDSLCWLLNIRGSDVHCTPFVLAYAFLLQDGTVDLFIDEKRVDNEVRDFLGDDIRVCSPYTLESYIKSLKYKDIQCDTSSTSLWFFSHIQAAGASIIKEKDLCQLPKACKNSTEQQGAGDAHIRDGVAVVKFLSWLEQHSDNGSISEISAAKQLLTFRQEQEGFMYPSFDTIAGFSSNGAIIHYHASEYSNKILTKNGLFLLDSGGQYKEATTDITRTIAIGVATSEQITRFTQVLKGHITLAMARFPEGTTGSQLDVLARHSLWQEGCDYAHGTGHGVGSCLSVHEGPQRIGKAPNTIALQTGMILSNEPGYYKASEYGIRIESLMVVEPCADYKNFLQFKTLTCVPIDKRLIDKTLLSMAEIAWLDSYHQQVKQALLPYCTDLTVKLWIEENTKPI